MLKKIVSFNVFLLLSIVIFNIKTTNNLNSNIFNNSQTYGSNFNNRSCISSIASRSYNLFSQFFNRDSFEHYLRSQTANLSDCQVNNIVEISKALAKISNKNNPSKDELDIAIKIINCENNQINQETFIDYLYGSNINHNFKSKVLKSIKKINIDDLLDIFELVNDFAKRAGRSKPSIQDIDSGLTILSDQIQDENDYITLFKSFIGKNGIKEDEIEVLIDFVKALRPTEINHMFKNLGHSFTIDTLYEKFIFKSPSGKTKKTNNKKIIEAILNFYAKKYNLTLDNSVKDLIINGDSISAIEIKEQFKNADRRAIRFDRDIKDLDLLYVFYKQNPITNEKIIEDLIEDIAQIYTIDSELINNNLINNKIIKLFKGKKVSEIEAIFKESNIKRINRNGNAINYSDIIISFISISKLAYRNLDLAENQSIVEYYLPNNHCINQDDLKTIASAILIDAEYLKVLINFTKSFQGKENLSFKDFCIGLYYFSSNREVEPFLINILSNKPFFDKFKIILFDHFLEEYQNNLTDEFKQRFLKDISIDKMSKLQNLIQASSNLAYKANRNAIEEIDLQRATKDLRIDYKNSFLLNGDDFKTYVKAEHKADDIHRLQLIVKNQFAADGGGFVSDGYHAIKNGAVISQIIQALPENRNQELKNLLDSDLVNLKFGKENSLWRSYIIKKRRRDLAKLFMYETILYQIKGEYEISRGSARPKDIERPLYCLPFCQGWLSFKPFENQEDSNEERTQICNILFNAIEILVGSKANLLDNLHGAQSIQFFPLEIKNKLISLLKDENIISDIEAHNQVDKYIPNINSLYFNISKHRLREGYSEVVLNLNFIKPYMVGGTGIGRMQGEWLDPKEMSKIVKFAKRGIYNNNHRTIVAILDEDSVEDNSKIISIKKRLKDKDSKFIAIIPIYDDGNWILLVINKQGESHQYILANSANNSLVIDHPRVLDLINFLEDKVINPSNLQEGNEDLLNSEVPFEAQCGKDDIPSLGLIFNNDIPKQIQAYINGVNDPDYLLKANKGLSKYLLLPGPPGVGKSTLVQYIAREIDADVIYKNGADFITKWQGSAKANLTKTFNYAKKYARENKKKVIIFIDEIDGIAKSVSNKNTDETHNGVVALQDLLNKWQSNKRVIVIGATNNQELIKDAVSDRFTTIKIKLPCYSSRKEIIEFYLRKKGLLERVSTTGFMSNLTSVTKGFSGRDLIKMINLADVTLHLKIPAKKLQWYTFGWNLANPAGIWSDRIGLWEKSKKTGSLICGISGIGSLIHCAMYLRCNEAENHLYWAYSDVLKQKKLETNSKTQKNDLEGLPLAISSISSAFSIYSSLKLIAATAVV